MRGADAGDGLVDVEAEVVASAVVDGARVVADLSGLVVNQNVDDVRNVALKKRCCRYYLMIGSCTRM